jgi:hypothetical protein
MTARSLGISPSLLLNALLNMTGPIDVIVIAGAVPVSAPVDLGSNRSRYTGAKLLPDVDKQITTRRQTTELHPCKPKNLFLIDFELVVDMGRDSITGTAGATVQNSAT